MGKMILLALLFLPSILGSNGPTSLTIPAEAIKMQIGVQPQVHGDLTLNERMLKMETKSKQQENQISFLTETVVEDKKEIKILKGRLEKLENAPSFSGNQNHKSGVKNRREAGSKLTSTKEQMVCTGSSKRCTFFYPDNPDVVINTRDSSFLVKNLQKYVNKSLEHQQNLNRQPTNCKELHYIGHTLDGFYLVKGNEANANKIQIVYCNFQEENVLNNIIGNVELKTQSVHFYVQRTKTDGTPGMIPFQKEVLNIGGAMNLDTGLFTAPVNGVYHFEFAALKDYSVSSESYVHLVVNGKEVATSYAKEGEFFIGHSGISASLLLKASDKVGIEKTDGGFADWYHRYTHFTGWLVEQQIELAKS